MPRIGCFCHEDENLDKEAVFIKEGALAFACQSGRYMLEDINMRNNICCIFNLCFSIIAMFVERI
jgi:hypothetical protein